MTSNPLRILCVDDEPAVLEVLALYLSRAGFAVDTASDGAAAWRMIEENPTRFDLVLTDNRMPRMTGLELIEHLRRAQFPGQLAVFSSTLAVEHVQRLQDLGVDAIIEKGRPFPEVVAELRRIVSIQSR